MNKINIALTEIASSGPGAGLASTLATTRQHGAEYTVAILINPINSKGENKATSLIIRLKVITAIVFMILHADQTDILITYFNIDHRLLELNSQ